jgi:putative flippase GtrA
MIAALRRLTSFYMTAQFAHFLVVGGIALVINWLSRFAFNYFVAYGWAIVLAYGAGMLVAFILNRVYVFPFSSRSLKFEMTLFFLVNIAVFPLVWGVAYVLGEWFLARYLSTQFALALAHGFAITLPAFVNFALHKLITFRGA